MPESENRIPLILAALGVHLLLVSYALVSIPSDPGLGLFLPSAELLLALGLLLFPFSKKGLRSLARWGAGALLGLLIFRLGGELFYRLFYLQSFSLLTDSRLVVGLAGMLLGDSGIPSWLLALAVWGLLGAFLLGLGRLSAQGILRAGVNKEEGVRDLRIPALAALAFSGLSLLFFPQNSALGSVVLELVQGPGDLSVSGEFDLRTPTPNLENLGSGGGNPSEGEGQGAGEEPGDPEYSFAAIQDRDIHFFVIESYGSTLFMRPEYRDTILDVYDAMEGHLWANGWSIHSGLVLSPAFGGRSWLADSSLLTGTQLSTQAIYDAEVEDGLPAGFLQLMGQAGYHRIYAAPGSDVAPKDWQVAYPFEEYLLRDDYQYQGPFINLGAMSDQYFLDRVGRLHLESERREFVLYLQVSSHVPFNVIPTYKPDWDFSAFGEEYRQGYLEYFDNNWLTGNELAEGYLAGIRYSLKTVEGYLEEHLKNDGFVLIIGDHQPRKPVSVSNAGYAVPFHILYPRELDLNIPEDWTLSSTMMPPLPELPGGEDELPLLARIPHLVSQMIQSGEDSFETGE